MQKPSTNSLFGGDSSKQIPVMEKGIIKGAAVVVADDDDWGDEDDQQ